MAVNGSELRDARLVEKIRRELGSIVSEALVDPNVIEILLNPDKTLWIEKAGTAMRAVGSIDPYQSESALKTIASFVNETLTPENPTLGCELPIDGSRFQGMIPPVVANPTFSIRKKAEAIFSLQDYIHQGVMTSEQVQKVIQAIQNHKNILLVGSTGSGKTTLANAMIKQIVEAYPDERIVIIEDTNEIQCAADNSVILRTNKTTTILALLQATMRLRPDRVLVGEVRGKEAWTLLKAWNTGHPGGLVTVHANDALAGLLRIEQLSAEDPNAPRQVEYLRGVIGETVDMVLFLRKTKTGRVVQEIIEVNGFKNGEYNTNNALKGERYDA